MKIIYGKEAADELRTKYTVLDLEVITVPEKGSMPLYCVIPGDKIPLDELPILESTVKLHHDFMEGYHSNQYAYCLQCIEYLMGKFGGEVDTFYEEIKRRIELNG